MLTNAGAHRSIVTDANACRGTASNNTHTIQVFSTFFTQ